MRTYRIARTLWAGLFPLYLMEKLSSIPNGFEIVDIDQYDETLIKLASGEIDANFNSLADALLLVAKGLDLKLIMPSDLSIGIDGFITRPEVGGIKNLVGKRIGLALLTYPHVLLQMILKKNNISINDVTLIDSRGEEIVEAVLTGKVDVGHTWGVYIDEAILRGLKVLFTSSEYPGLLVDSLVVRSEALDSDMERWKSLITAHDKVIEWWKEHPQEGNQLLSEITGLSVKKITKMVEGFTFFTRNTSEILFDKSIKTLPGLYASGKLFNHFFIENGVMSERVKLEEIFHPL
jgi:NitT/TauT family transport system substrate-binding protein